MPQLVPFYYMNEVVFAFAIIVFILYVLSKYILPRIVRLFYHVCLLIKYNMLHSCLPACYAFIHA